MAANSSGALRDAAMRANLRADGENNCSRPSSTNINSSSADGAFGASGAVNANQPNARIADLLSTLNISASAAKSTQRGVDAPHRDSGEDDDVKLDLELLREFVFSGGCQRDESTNSASIRPIAWRILLGVLDERPAQWQELLAEKRRTYQDWKREFLGCRRQSVVARQPHESSSPSSSNSSSSTARDAYEQDIALMKEIDKDVSRTQSALPFFAIGGIAQQWMLRILFVYAKLNPELGYMQGMNEILAPIVFVYGSDLNDEWAQKAEADAFYSFSTIMKSVKLLYLKSPTDPLKNGVDTQMTRLTQLLRQHDALLWQHLLPLVHDALGARVLDANDAAHLGCAARGPEAVQLSPLRELRVDPLAARAAAAGRLLGLPEDAADALARRNQVRARAGRADA